MGRRMKAGTDRRSGSGFGEKGRMKEDQGTCVYIRDCSVETQQGGKCILGVQYKLPASVHFWIGVGWHRYFWQFALPFSRALMKQLFFVVYGMMDIFIPLAIMLSRNAPSLTLYHHYSCECALTATHTLDIHTLRRCMNSTSALKVFTTIPAKS